MEWFMWLVIILVIFGMMGSRAEKKRQQEADQEAELESMAAGISCDENDLSLRFSAGYSFSKNFGFEASYVNFGKATASGLLVGVPVNGYASATAVQFAGTGALPLSDSFSLTAKAGVAFVTSKVSGSAGLIAASASAKDTNLVWGIGAQYNVIKNLAFRVNYENFGNVGDPATTGSAKLSNISAGVVVGF